MIRLAFLTAACALTLGACAQTATTDASAAPAKPKDFCQAMAAAATLAPAAATALDDLFTTIDAMGSGASEGDIDNLHALGANTTSTSETYAAALGTAGSMAPQTLVDDIATLQSYWTLYAVGLGQAAQDATSYGNLIDQTTALTTSEQAGMLITEQPDAQSRINDGYLSECAG